MADVEYPAQDTARVESVSEHHQLLASVMHAAERIHARLEAALAPCGLSLAKLGALRHLAEAQQPLPLGQLAERIACVKSNVTQLIDRVESDGFVKRLPDPEDRRSVRAMITEEGRERYQAGTDAVAAAERALVTELDLGDRHALQQLLQRLS